MLIILRLLFRAWKALCLVLPKNVPFLAWLITTCTPPPPIPTPASNIWQHGENSWVLKSLQWIWPLLEKVTHHSGELWHLVQEDSSHGACPLLPPLLQAWYTPANNRKCELLKIQTQRHGPWDVTHSGCLIPVVVPVETCHTCSSPRDISALPASYSSNWWGMTITAGPRGIKGAPAAHRAEVPGLGSQLLTFRWELVCPSEMFLSSVGTSMLAKSLQSCPTICNPMNCRLPGSSVYGNLQARILEWVAIPSSRGSSQARDGTCISYVSCIGRRVLYH